MKWMEWSLCLLLGILAIADYKNKKIPLWSVLAVFAIGLLNLHLQYYREWKNILSGSGVGVIICILSKATGNRIGMGDGFIIAAIGMLMGLRATLFCTGAAFLLASVAALFLLCIKRVGRNYNIPFVPYIFAAYVLTICTLGGRG